jgi:hypothetical protein
MRVHMHGTDLTRGPEATRKELENDPSQELFTMSGGNSLRTCARYIAWNIINTEESNTKCTAATYFFPVRVTLLPQRLAFNRTLQRRH